MFETLKLCIQAQATNPMINKSSITQAAAVAAANNANMQAAQVQAQAQVAQAQQAVVAGQQNALLAHAQHQQAAFAIVRIQFNCDL